MRSFPRLYSLLFLLPLAGYWISFLVGQPVPPNLGNRPLAPWPQMEHGPTSDWLQKAASWAIEQSPFRYRTIQVRNRLFLFAAERLFPVPVNPGHPQVCHGKDGWLFLLDETPEPRSKEGLHDLAKQGIKLARLVRQSGRRFYFVVFPDKMSVYPEYSGWTKRWAERHANRQLLPAIMAKTWAKAQDVADSYLPILPALLEAKAKSSEPLFWKMDTHWNNAGGVAATRALVNGIQPGLFEESSVVAGSSDNAGSVRPINDLMDIFLAQNRADQGPTYSIHRAKDLSSWTSTPLANPLYVGLPVVHTTSPMEKVVKGRTIVVGDSFAEAIFHLLTPWFEDLTFIHQSILGTPEMAEALKQSDTIIWCTVERALQERLQIWNGPGHPFVRAALTTKGKPTMREAVKPGQ